MAYKVYGTNQPYGGKVVNVGNQLFTTRGGALEGNSYEVVLVTPGKGNQNIEEDLPTMNAKNQMAGGTTMRGGGYQRGGKARKNRK